MTVVYIDSLFLDVYKRQGLLTVVVFNVLEKYSAAELQALSVL